jgi:hypothetical protein
MGIGGIITHRPDLLNEVPTESTSRESLDTGAFVVPVVNAQILSRAHGSLGDLDE